MEEQTQQVLSKPFFELDNTIKDRDARKEIVDKIIEDNPDGLSAKSLDILATYLTAPLTKKEKKEKKILTQNRLSRIKQRELSYEGLAQKFEGGEDAVYNLIANDKNIIFSPKMKISKKDLETIPELKRLRDEIEQIKIKYEKADEQNNRTLKSQLLKMLIPMRKKQYMLKNSYQQPIYFRNTKKSLNSISIDEEIIIDENGNCSSVGLFSLIDPIDVSILLCNYSNLKGNSWDKLYDDAYYLIMDLEDLIDKTLKEQYPMLFDILVYKIDKMSNEDIQAQLMETYGSTYSIEYISSLWRKKIPKILADQAQKDYLTWYYTIKEKGKWKRCSRCGEIKLAHNLFFSKNSTSKDGFYSLCKDCRNKKK